MMFKVIEVIATVILLVALDYYLVGGTKVTKKGAGWLCFPPEHNMREEN